jgi:predicted NBD/HSP70 family sugar kinase
MPAGDNIDGVRRRNLATILELVHHGSGASRAELTALTGLNRSTVAALVAELADAGLLREGEPVASGAVGRPSPGLVRASDGTVRWAPHLGWREVPFARLVEDAVGHPVQADNDASLGALAEHLFGAGRGVADLVYLNGGPSGIGGGVVVRGELLTGRGGYAGEFGQNRPGAGERLSQNGTLEDEVNRARLLGILGLAEADEPALAAAVDASDDPRIAAELRRQQGILAVALANAINVFNPELVVLGGYLATHLAWDPPSLADAVTAATIPAAAEGVSIVPAALGEDRLLIGAAELAFRRLLRDPASWR